MAKSTKKTMAEEMASSNMSDDMQEHMDGDCCASGMCGAGMPCGMGVCGMPDCGRGSKIAKCLVKLTASLLFLMLAICVGMQMWGNPWYKNIRAEFTAQPYARTISVEGEGKIVVQPDIAKVDLSVTSVGKTVKEVTDDGNKKMNAVRDEMKNLGIKAEDMKTSQYNLYPQYDYNTVIDRSGIAKPAAIIGYNLTQTLSLKIRDLGLTDQVLDKSITAGANQVGQLTFDLDDASQIKIKARQEAFQKAREKAQQMASAAGVNLGKVVTFSEGSSGGIVMPYANFTMKAMSADAAVAPSVEAGSQELMVNVSVTYEIE